MQQSEAFHRQLRASYAAIVADSFARARHCLGLARQARQSGDCAEVRRWMWCVRVLRVAAAEWRKRAQRIAPVILACVISFAGCARQDEMSLSFWIDSEGTVRWTLVVPESTWHHMRPAQIDRVTFDLDDDTSGRLISAINEELARKNLCPEHWSFRPGLVLRNGTLVFVGQCDQQLVKG